ncbi:MAG: Gfo/Idh/MocA family oxidoreductase [Ignavibacteriaceae bacterium]|jgi:predicted dehydrogenase|nr:Gfo/Idh/MocA family oxidoreductase [Ignavibacteriaceae bacterium]
MNVSIKWGILGNATIARKCVIPAIFNSTNGSVHALASRNLKKADALAKKYDITHLYAKYDSVIEDQQVDIVYVPLPNHLHKEWTIKALEAGKHVLCEKPLACNTAEAIEMEEVASKKGLHLMEALMYRFHPRSTAIHKMVSQGKIGTPRLVRASFCFHMDEHMLKKKENARLKKKGGGALLDVGSYGVSVARWMMGENPESVQATAHFNAEGVDIHAVGVLQFKNGGLATVEASFVSSLQQTYTIVGEDGSIELPHNAFIPWEKDATYVYRGRNEEIGRQEVIPGTDEYRLMVEHFSDVLIHGSSPLVQIHDSLQNMRVLDALAESARSGQRVVIPEKQI